MKMATDDIQRGVYDGRQLGIKILCNSAYGALGASGQIGDKDCAAAVTAWGREALYLVRDYLEEKYDVSTEFGKAECVGGDTDSVFMTFSKIKTVKRVEEISKMMEDELNVLFEKPMEIEYEKCFFWKLMTSKKRYCGIMFERGKPGKFFSKGMETVRRDAMPFTKKVLNRIFDSITIEDRELLDAQKFQQIMCKQLEGVCKYIRKSATDLLEGRVPIADMVLSRQLSREFYRTEKLPHLTIIHKMEERGEEPPHLGERVPFVYILMPNDSKTRKEKKGYERVEHPDYAIKHNMDLDYQHYLERMFKEPVLRIMSLLIKDAEKYLFGTTKKSGIVYRDKALRYASLTRKRKLVTLSEDSAFYELTKPTKKQQIESLQIKYEVDNPQKVLEIEKIELKEIEKEREKRLGVCRACVKQGDEAPIICAAFTCEHYFPRVAVQGTYQRKLNEIRDIEDLIK